MSFMASVSAACIKGPYVMRPNPEAWETAKVVLDPSGLCS